VFAIPDSTDQSNVYLDKVNLVDLTLNNYANGYTEEDVQKIFLYFRSIALALASRDAAVTSGVFGENGGSRAEYRYHPEFGTFTKAATISQYILIDISR
jgi:hypothetical protein